jgi:Family of unknown function (DUF6588)
MNFETFGDSRGERVLGFPSCLIQWVWLVVLMLFPASSAVAQLESHLSAYTGRNAPGYFGPVVDAIGADLSSGLYHTARIPKEGFHVSLELIYMSARFSSGERSFVAFTEGDFRPEQSAVAPTVVGSKDPVSVEGDAGTKFWFPGGFDIAAFDFATPQLRVGSILGTEALVRFVFIPTGDEHLGTPSLYGVGFRHSVSQYFNDLPIDAAVGAFWQRSTLGENERGGDIVSADAWTVGFQASKRYSWLEPYVGVAYNNLALDLSYEGDAPEDVVDLSLDSGDHFRMTLGVSVNVSFLAVHGEYNSGGQDAFALGLAVGYHPLR